MDDIMMAIFAGIGMGVFCSGVIYIGLHYMLAIVTTSRLKWGSLYELDDIKGSKIYPLLKLANKIISTSVFLRFSILLIIVFVVIENITVIFLENTV